jgi:hypothetical protein
MNFLHHESMNRLVTLVLVGLAIVVTTRPTRAQFNGDPFDPYRAAYRSSSVPMSNQFAPGQPRRVVSPGMGTVPGIGRPSDLSFTIPPLGPPTGVGRLDRIEEELFGPLGDVYRRYDEDFNRVYRPNEFVDRESGFAEAQEERRRLYLQASQERDPQRRAELMRKYQDLSRRISLGLSPSASRNILNTQAGREEQSGPRRGVADRPSSADELPTSIRSYEDLLRWSRIVNREALKVGVVPGGEN